MDSTFRKLWSGIVETYLSRGRGQRATASAVLKHKHSQEIKDKMQSLGKTVARRVLGQF